MGKIIISEFSSLDGVVEAPEKWSFEFWNHETEKFKSDELAAHSAMLLGRVTYQGFAAAWPSRTGDYADRFNGLPKFVASRSLKKVDWPGSELLADPLPGAVANLKQKVKGNIYIHGSISLSQTLLGSGLVDEVHLLSYPVILGAGRRLFGASQKVGLDLISSQAFGNGVLALKYRVRPL